MAWTQKLSSVGMQAFADCFELLRRHRSMQPKEFCSTSLPFTMHRAALVIVVAMLQVPLRVSLAACHGSYRQHRPTLRLFEIPMQAMRTQISAKSGAIRYNFRSHHHS